MTERLSRSLVIAGSILFTAGLLLWAERSLDQTLHHAFRLVPGGPWVRPARLLSMLGGLAVMGPAALACCGWLVWRRERRRALWLFATIAGGRLLVEGIKPIVTRPRPPIAERLADVTSWSFPSSHSAGTMMTGMALAMLAGGRPGAILGALAWTMAVGWSRVALGVHWPSDVLAGWGFGLVWIGLAARYGGPMRSG